MPKRIKKPEVIIPEPPDTATDKSDEPTRAEVIKHAKADVTHAQVALADLRVTGPCPTCGTAKTGNRCDVCGRQEHDT